MNDNGICSECHRPWAEHACPISAPAPPLREALIRLRAENEELRNAPPAVTETSLSRLSENDWRQLSNNWQRGVDWYVRKIGRKWAPIDAFGKFPLFGTKREAEEAATTLLLMESRCRMEKRNATA